MEKAPAETESATRSKRPVPTNERVSRKVQKTLNLALAPLSTQIGLMKATYTFLGRFEFGSLICAVSTSSNMLIIGRAIAGMGSAGTGNGALTILSASIPLEKRAYLLIILTLIGLVGQLGVVFSPLIGGALTEYTIWRWYFCLNLLIGAIAVAALLWVAVPKIKNEGPKRMNFVSLFRDLDLAGCLLFSPAMVMFLLTLEWEDRHTLEIVQLLSVSSADLLGVRGMAPTLSEVYMLPGILGRMVFGIMAGLAVTRLGYYLPWSVISTAIAAVGSGLISTFTEDTNTGTWIGYQIIGGLGRVSDITDTLGQPLVAVQNNLPASQIAVSMAFLKFCQNFGGSLMLSLLQNGFRYAPGVFADTVSSIGVSGIRTMIPQASVKGVIMAYVIAVQEVFYIVAGTAAAALVFSWELGWKSVQKAKNRPSKA
ncbi:efflux pump antibiotic resistance protein, putative [Talaromyces stipitatus ATCC 10500]|uniref:Efflux pump antibiotic resistance protein, putative n=1 Tax=Talaromyces stipitatus (strain ATCC 10500 / CBS 375.48 / QM 6759 / NRRL 1006) TaxID=441959 RepID=B8LWY9_TALSN|nr:efflux pump antibiotic resistance protein, putative [Talaromyces stipitatus ATCC 10500]EED24622.1 efflux pump antibiotic resistance protein, putative [Talaromyces stipitatus ATCC 10500]